MTICLQPVTHSNHKTTQRLLKAKTGYNHRHKTGFSDWVESMWNTSYKNCKQTAAYTLSQTSNYYIYDRHIILEY